MMSRSTVACWIVGFIIVIALVAVIAVRAIHHGSVDYQIERIERQSASRYKIREARRVLDRIGSDAVYEYLLIQDGTLREGAIFLVIEALRAGDARFYEVVTELANDGWVLARHAIDHFYEDEYSEYWDNYAP